MISKKFIQSSFIYSIVGALPLASSLVLLPFYLNLLSIKDVGILALYLSFTYLIQIIVNFALDTSIGVSYFDYRDDNKKLKEYIGTVVSLLLIIGLIITILFLITGNGLFNLIFRQDSLVFFPYGLMSIVTAIFNSFFKTYTNLLINRQEPIRFFWLNILNFVLTIAISLGGLYLYPYSLIGPMWGRLLSGIGIFIVAFYYFFREYGICFKTIFLKGIYLFCFPMLIYYILTWVLSYIDRFIINDFLSLRDVAIFDFAVKCTLLIEYLQMGLTSSITPKIFALWKKNDIRESTPEVNRYYNGYTALNILGLPVFIIFVPLIVPYFVTNKDYFEGFYFLNVLCLGFIFRGLYTMFLAPVYFFKKTKVLPKVFLFSAAFQIIITIVFIKYFGLYGVVWANFISKPVQTFFLFLESRKIFEFKFNFTKQIFLPVIYILLIVVSEIFMIERYRILIEIAQLFIVFSLVIWTYQKELVLVINQVLKRK